MYFNRFCIFFIFDFYSTVFYLYKSLANSNEIINNEYNNDKTIKSDTIIRIDQNKIISKNSLDKDSIIIRQNMELLETKARLEILEERIKELESRIPRKYPDVKFLNHKNRKRILVRTFLKIV